MFNKRQKEIMRAAIDIAGQEGMKALTINNIARRISLTDGAIYRHFSSKDDIICGILKTIFLGMTQRVGEIITQSGTASSKLKNIIEFVLHDFKENPAHESFLFAEDLIFANKSQRVFVYNVLNTIQLYIQQTIEQGQAQKELTAMVDAKNISLLFIGTIRVLVMKWKLSGYQLDIEEEGRQFYTTLMSLLRKVN
ncbi:MAG TPA: TetR/AcrR family transcriptional regulator [Mariniphaga anaerophila]|uniref:TetR/AcrR family transcriptional regulator n=1 Tax=Mariniphaga anaerophila TaxID=1484053 RepID=A0A831LXY6_9BACT|nr:TetR/AcrR family transcriptional regulator [Mariniphaga anaerophila]